MVFQEYVDMFLPEIGVTLLMVGLSTFFACLFGLFLGILVVITRKDSILPMPFLHAPLEWIVNIGRSIPYIILMVAILPPIRAIFGIGIGWFPATITLFVAAIPFVARLVESSFSEIDSGMIEAAQSMGATTPQIVFKVMLPESVPSLILGLSLTAITLVGYSAMAGAIGGGGLGDLAVRQGYYRSNSEIMYITIVILIIIVQIIQSIFGRLSRGLDKRLR